MENKSKAGGDYLKRLWILLMVMLCCIAIAACGTKDLSRSSPPPSPPVIATVVPTTEAIDSDSPGPVIDDKVDPKIVSVISDHVQAIQTRDENLIKSTVLSTIKIDERAYMLWHADSGHIYEVSKISFQFGDEKNAVIDVSFENGEFYSFVMTNTNEGWKLYDID